MRQFTPVKFTDVKVEGDFWRERLETVLTRTIPSQYDQLVEHGILESLNVPKPTPPLRIPPTSHGILHTGLLGLRRGQVDRGGELRAVAPARRDDRGADRRRSPNGSPRRSFPTAISIAGISGARSTNAGPTSATTTSSIAPATCSKARSPISRRPGGGACSTSCCATSTTSPRCFGRGEGQKRGYCGHQEIELALVKLYHVTQDRKHLDLAAYFIDERGSSRPTISTSKRSRGATTRRNTGSRPTNTASRTSRCASRTRSSATRSGRCTSTPPWPTSPPTSATTSLKRACERLWKDVTTKRMYVTAGLGPAAANEGFTTDYDLPNDTAYAETCASVALIFWAQRMLNLELDGAYADVMELALYNGALSGLSRDGTQYFYQNPLESDGSHTRWDWHPCPCCTMNVSRLVASVGGYFYSTGADVIAVHLYGGKHGDAERRRADGPDPPGDRLSLVGKDQDRRRSRRGCGLLAEAQDSRLGAERRARRQRRARRPFAARARLCRRPARMAGRRHPRARPAHAGRAAFMQIRKCGRMSVASA